MTKSPVSAKIKREIQELNIDPNNPATKELQRAVIELCVLTEQAAALLRDVQARNPKAADMNFDDLLKTL